LRRLLFANLPPKACPGFGIGVRRFAQNFLSRALVTLAIVGFLLGQAGARLHAACLLSSIPHAHLAHDVTAHHTHEPSAPSKPAHADGACVTACCIGLSWADPVLEGGRVSFDSKVWYGIFAEFPSGRSHAPEPGIPKNNA
jgi:hypothetical protein